MRPVSVVLSSSARAMLISHLSLLPERVRERGAALMSTVEIHAAEPDHIAGAMRDRKEIDWDVFPEEPDPETHYSSCDCAGFHHCPHVAAAITAVLRAAQMKQAAPALTETDLGALVKSKTGKPPDKASLRFLQQVQAWWDSGRSVVSAHDLMRLCSLGNYYDPRQIRLYPEELKPQGASEYFYCVAAAAESNSPGHFGKQCRLPDAIAAALDRTWLEDFRKRCARLEQIEKWKSTLRHWDHDTLEADGKTGVPELRLLLHHNGATLQIRRPDQAEFGKLTAQALKQLDHDVQTGDLALDPCSAAILHASSGPYGGRPRQTIDAGSTELTRCLQQLLSSEQTASRHVSADDGSPLVISPDPLRYQMIEPSGSDGDYEVQLLTPAGGPAPAFLAVIGKNPALFVTPRMAWPGPPFPFPPTQTFPLRIPAPVIESGDGLKLLSALGLPPPARIASSVKLVPLQVRANCRIQRNGNIGPEYFQLSARAGASGVSEVFNWRGDGWARAYPGKEKVEGPSTLVQLDRSALAPAAAWLRRWSLRSDYNGRLELRTTKDFPDQFLDWLAAQPEGVKLDLDAELASLRDGVVSGSFALEIEESKSGIDWFDLTMQLKVEDHTLTQAEIDLLLKAKGRWVSLPGKGWRKLQFQLTPEQERELAELGISSAELNGERHRLHTLQMAGALKNGSSLLPAERAAQVQRRIEEIRMDVTPPQPEGVTATLRPYQLEGFHFLAFLSTNRFGGVLADDMGLGKTLQALTWLAWLRGDHGLKGPVLVVCPKSVQENWRSEAARFFPSLPVHTWSRGAAGVLPADMDGLLIVHYPQLRQHEALLQPVKWAAVILDEAQAIKNPSSQTASAACGLNAAHRLALTGTPVENRLMDLWSIFAFAMPGLLGTRAAFTRQFDSKADPLARRRLAARTRPFLLRRTKKEVAGDLPDRVEEDVMVEMEGAQATLYQAELKRARAQLLKISTGSQLDKLRFNILTSLLRLRQICCHPALLGLESDAPPGPSKGPKTKAAKEAPEVESGKLSALMEHLEAIIEEEQKVLVFSQFTGMLDLIAAETDARGWTRFLLTGQTEERGALVNEFQSHTGPAVFLISLKAGGFGLNLTAASYVVLYDPWWNPAVEAQAIDRTHRIGQKQTVFAYRLLMKDTIEEKIRALQKQKGALAHDILGEENFARALSLDDFRFLLGD